ncbi:MAG: FAD-binding protein [Actinobacteria bacterium]|nr:MAG: FAD-binding protein [Actinomycetota bacterium]
MRKPKVGAFTRTPMFRASTRKLESSSMSMRFRSWISSAIAFPFPSIVAGFVSRHTPFPGGCQADLVRLRRGGCPAPRRRIGMAAEPDRSADPFRTEAIDSRRSSRSCRRRLLAEPPAEYLADQTEGRGLTGRADAVALPGSTAEVAAAVAWCYDHDVPIVPRGGGTGFAGGAVPIDGGVVLSLERLIHVRSFEPLLWRIEVEAGLRTAELRRIVRESGLLFPPDPGAAEQSQIGGNIATNAGGAHAFKYGVTGAWVTGLEAVIPPGDVVAVGGPIRKDVAGYDLKSLLIGSERGRPAGRGVLRRLGSGLRCARARARQRVDRCGTRVSGRGHARTRRQRLPRRRSAGGGFPRAGGGGRNGWRSGSTARRAHRRSQRGRARRRQPRGPGRRRALALARRRLDRGRHGSRRQSERGHRGPLRPARRGGRRDGCDRAPPRSRRLQLGTRG